MDPGEWAFLRKVYSKLIPRQSLVSQVFAHRPRLVSLDVFRGVTIAAMLLVNNPGSWGHIYPPLRHAEWHGCTPTDLIFPFFLFIVGAAMAFSLRDYLSEERRADARLVSRVIRRVLLLLVLGLFLNAFPRFEFADLRLPGVLQRIALVYAIAVAVLVTLSARRVAAAAAIVLLGYWAMLALIPVDGVTPALSADGNLPRLVDLAVMGPQHLWSGSPTDPEGLLSTLPASVTCLLGVVAGVVVRDREPRAAIRRLCVLGVSLAAVGYAWSFVLPFNKPLWTPSFVLWTAGLAMLSFAACYWLVDVRGARKVFSPFERMGLNAITAFVGSGLLARVLVMIEVGDGTLKSSAYDALVRSGLAPINASLAFALGTVVLWMLILWAMERAGIRLRV